MSDFRLKVFRSVAKNLSFTKASQELFVSQPAITKHIQELEAAYQTRLFDRQGSRISLTESGNLLLEHCERILEDYKRLEYEMHLLHNEYTGGLKLGASTTIAQYVLPRLPNIRYTTFLEDELVAVVRTGSKLAVGEEITPDELFHLPLVLRERGSGTLDVFERALQQHNIKLSSLQVLMYLGSTESIKLFLEHTDCLGIVSVRSITRELYSGQLRVVEIKGMPMLRDFSFAQPQGQESGLAQVFMQFAMHNNHKL